MPIPTQLPRLTPLLLLTLLLPACALRPHGKFGDLPEPHRSTITTELREHPNSPLARASRGEPAALHTIFQRALDPALDGGASESFLFQAMAIRSTLGDDRFFAALAHEPAEVQQAMEMFAPKKD